MDNIFHNDEAYGVLGVRPDCTMHREVDSLPPKTESEILGSRAFLSKHSLEKWMKDDNDNHHLFASRYDALWKLPRSPLFPGFLVGLDPAIARYFIDGYQQFFLWVEYDGFEYDLSSRSDPNTAYKLMGTYSLRLRRANLSVEQFRYMRRECQDELISLIFMAGDDPDEMDTAHISYAQIKRQAMTLGVTITGLGIRDALLNGLLKIPVFRIDPCYYDVTDLDELFEYDTD